MRWATLLMLVASATEEPPYFWTTMPTGFPMCWETYGLRDAARDKSTGSPQGPAPVILPMDREKRSTSGGGAADRRPALERAAEGELVGVLEVAADGQSAGELADPQAERRQHADEVGRGGLALGVGVGRDDDLGDDA